MDHRRPGRFVIIAALAILGLGAGQGVAAQPEAAAAGQAEPSPGYPASHPYKFAIRAVENYGTCRVPERDAIHAALMAEFRRIEAAAVAKGIGPVLERLRREYEAFMAVADVMACAGGPVRALAEARDAVAAFRAWVEAQPDEAPAAG